MWQRDAFDDPLQAEQAAAQAHLGAGAPAARRGVHFDLERDGAGWFWHPLPASCLRVGGRVSRARVAEEAALRGEIPAPPSISTESKSYTYAKACLRFHDAAVRGDRDVIRMGRIFGVSTHALLVRRYQRALLAALNIRGVSA